jgi:hypothetical protein
MPGLDLDNISEFVTTCTMIGITQLRVSTRTTYLMWPSYCCLDINTISKLNMNMPSFIIDLASSLINPRSPIGTRQARERL